MVVIISARDFLGTCFRLSSTGVRQLTDRPNNGLTADSAWICVPDYDDKFRNRDGQTDFIFHSAGTSGTDGWRYLGIASTDEILSESMR